MNTAAAPQEDPLSTGNKHIDGHLDRFITCPGIQALIYALVECEDQDFKGRVLARIKPSLDELKDPDVQARLGRTDPDALVDYHWWLAWLAKSSCAESPTAPEEEPVDEVTEDPAAQAEVDDQAGMALLKNYMGVPEGAKKMLGPLKALLPVLQDLKGRDEFADRQSLGSWAKGVVSGLATIDRDSNPAPIIDRAYAKICRLCDKVDELKSCKAALPDMVGRLGNSDRFLTSLYWSLVSIDGNTNSDLAHDVLPRGDIDVQAILEERPDLSPLVQVYELASEITEELAEIEH